MLFPDRLSGLIAKLEAGDTLTQKEVDRIATLQLLDMAKVGEDFVRENIALNELCLTELEKS